MRPITRPIYSAHFLFADELTSTAREHAHFTWYINSIRPTRYRHRRIMRPGQLDSARVDWRFQRAFFFTLRYSTNWRSIVCLAALVRRQSFQMTLNRRKKARQSDGRLPQKVRAPRHLPT